jgi:hypothetical protein
MSSSASTKRGRLRPRGCRKFGHAPGPWWACACDQGIPSHLENGWRAGPCAFEVRLCRRCGRVVEERHVADPATAVTVSLPQPGGQSAKTIRRAGSPNHLQGSKETPSVEPLASAAQLAGGWPR